MAGYGSGRAVTDGGSGGGDGDGGGVRGPQLVRNVLARLGDADKQRRAVQRGVQPLVVNVADGVVTCARAVDLTPPPVKMLLLPVASAPEKRVPPLLPPFRASARNAAALAMAATTMAASPLRPSRRSNARGAPLSSSLPQQSQSRTSVDDVLAFCYGAS
jgi:hypothetical protein